MKGNKDSHHVAGRVVWTHTDLHTNEWLDAMALLPPSVGASVRHRLALPERVPGLERAAALVLLRMGLVKHGKTLLVRWLLGETNGKSQFLGSMVTQTHGNTHLKICGFLVVLAIPHLPARAPAVGGLG